MKKRKMLLILPFILLLAITWIAVSASEVDYVEKQNELVESVEQYLQDELYIRCIPAYEEACSYETEQTSALEKKLLEIYEAYGDMDSYYELMSERIDKATADAEEYIIMADYFIANNEYTAGMDIIRSGMNIFDDEQLKNYYDAHHYEYIFISGKYAEMLPVCSGVIPVSNGDGWGYLSTGGKLICNFVYESVTPFSDDFAIVKIEEKYYCINSDFDKWSVDKNAFEAVKQFSSGYARALKDGKWCFINSEMQYNNAEEDWIGAFSEGMAAFSRNGKYGFYSTDLSEVVSPEYEGVAVNDFEQAYNSGRAFVKNDKGYILIDEKGNQIGSDFYESACAFMENGKLAAVKKDGKWGFVNTDGKLIIDYQFDDAKSFSSNGMAAVSFGGKWGYINAEGNSVIDYIFEEARPFVEIEAQVYYQDGWMLISLLDKVY